MSSSRRLEDLDDVVAAERDVDADELPAGLLDDPLALLDPLAPGRQPRDALRGPAHQRDVVRHGAGPTSRAVGRRGRTGGRGRAASVSAPGPLSASSRASRRARPPARIAANRRAPKPKKMFAMNSTGTPYRSAARLPARTLFAGSSRQGRRSPERTGHPPQARPRPASARPAGRRAPSSQSNTRHPSRCHVTIVTAAREDTVPADAPERLPRAGRGRLAPPLRRADQGRPRDRERRAGAAEHVRPEPRPGRARRRAASSCSRSPTCSCTSRPGRSRPRATRRAGARWSSSSTTRPASSPSAGSTPTPPARSC